MNNCKEQLTYYADMLESALAGYIPQQPHPETLVCEAMKYSLLSGGKRIRGALVLAFYNLFKSNTAAALPYAGAVEMIHAYSLIHDDLPCMDDDTMRRGKPSCHIAYGESTALLAGDGLLTLAFETMANSDDSSEFSAPQTLQAISCLAQAAGCSGMIGGQVIDLYQEGKAASEELLQRTNEKKTGALIKASAEIGCILGGATEEQRIAASQYGNNIGLSFQIIDDILDVTGDADVLGKNVGSDDKKHKSTYIQLYGMAGAREKADALNHAAKQALHVFEGDTKFLMELVDVLANRKN